MVLPVLHVIFVTGGWERKGDFLFSYLSTESVSVLCSGASFA